MIDLHAHLLPGIDDGAGSLDESLAMARRAAADGCEVIVATPHQRHHLWWNADRVRLDALRAELERRLDGAIEILPGAEIRVDSALLDDLDAGLPTPIADGRYLLIEFARNGIGPEPESIVHELVVAGWRPILAHPELLPWIAEDLPRLEDLVELGATLQITAMSVLGRFGRRPRESARALLDAGLAHFLASDCHGIATRPPGLSAAREVIAKGWGEELAERLTDAHPRAVIEDRPLPAW